MNTINRMFKHKKAVSPLIATVLLIAFAVALGAVVMNWGRGYVEDTAQVARQKSDSEVKCTSDVDIDFVSIDNTPQVCYNISDTLSGTGNDTIFFVLENKKDVYIRKIQARLIGGTSRTPLIVDLGNYSEMTGVQAKLFNLTYSESLGSPPSQLKLIPTIRSGGQDVTCAANGRTAIDILPCERVFGDG